MLISKIRTSLSCRTVEGEGALEATGSSGRKNFPGGLKKHFSQTITHVMDKLQARIQRVSSTKRRTVMKNLIDGIENEQAIEALLAAKKAPYPHKRSPALPLQVAYDYTKLKNESDIEWAYRFVKMDGEEFKSKIGWDRVSNCWSSIADHCVGGREILTKCFNWHKNGWDFSRFPCNYFTRPEEDLIEKMDPNAFQRMEESLIPVPGEVIRRSWNQILGAKELLFSFDIWRENSEWFCWHLLIESEQTLVIGMGVEKFWKIEGFIAPMIVPKHATRSLDSDDECEYVVHDEEDDAEDDAEEEEEE